MIGIGIGIRVRERERERENIIGMLLMNIVIFSYEPARKPLYYKI